MSSKQILAPAPDVDFIVETDRMVTVSRGEAAGTILRFETSVVVPSERVGELKKLLRDSTDDGRKIAYGFVLGFASDTLIKHGNAHAVVQAAFGIIKHDPEEAKRLKRGAP